MAIDLNDIEVIVTQLEADTIVLGKIVNDVYDLANPGEEDGTVTTRLGDVVKNVQRVINDMEQFPDDYQKSAVYDTGVEVVEFASILNFSGGSVSVTDGGSGTANIAITGNEQIYTGAGAPAVTPDFIGQRYVDTTNDYLYYATGIADANDWSRVISDNNNLESFTVALSDETTSLETGTDKITFRMAYAMTLTEVRASVGTAPTDAALIVDINKGGSTIFSSLLQIDSTDKTSVGSAAPAVLSTTSLEDDAEITIDLTQVGSTVPGAGAKITFIGLRT